ncbi:hypothetical protein BLNAU_13416 [Blattamonas nauphoetae]|uniref:Transposase n=1 Tax=Blattamonas nauphoetae TaxID=2049346 RepID=A0ABQ9XJV3_9EUKA|nr:hypothetical protein BLNAU_13416 [Blattamonas nauphoetae]
MAAPFSSVLPDERTIEQRRNGKRNGERPIPNSDEQSGGDARNCQKCDARLLLQHDCPKTKTECDPNTSPHDCGQRSQSPEDLRRNAQHSSTIDTAAQTVRCFAVGHLQRRGHGRYHSPTR